MSIDHQLIGYQVTPVYSLGNEDKESKPSAMILCSVCDTIVSATGGPKSVTVCVKCASDMNLVGLAKGLPTS